MAERFIQNVKFDERGLIPAIVQDAATSEVIELCYMDNASLVKTLQTGQTFFSVADPAGLHKPTRHRLVDVRVNSDGRSLTVLVNRESQEPPEEKPMSLLRDIEDSQKSATEVSLVDVGLMEFSLAINNLYALIAERKQKRPEGSYTTYLFNSGLDKILKKIAEETGEVIIAAKNRSQRDIVCELADLFYHILVLMVERDVSLGDVHAELARRAALPSSRSGQAADVEQP
jgi:phosphoribosyl-ATP pyrophosphohydrolase/phosphoribosyl-AMP cyclohydrolase